MSSKNGESKRQGSTLSKLPAVHRLLAHPLLQDSALSAPPAVVAASVRHVLNQAREQLKRGDGAGLGPDEETLAAAALAETRHRLASSLRGAINATGIVLHTGLGRARLPAAAREALLEVAGSHANIEIDRETGRRGSRQEHVRGLLCELTGAEEAVAVNNCAGAVLLAVAVLAAGREVIISRGQLVEIGGAFRMPDIIRAGGALLVEVGTTNRTRLADYERAITERTGLILRCHPSNFAIVGFTEETSIAELAALGRERRVAVMDDQGNGALVNMPYAGPAGAGGTVGDSVASGCDVVTASGDKLLGGPQAGLILGKREQIARIAAHPMARALRIDKFTLAALEATLRLYRDPQSVAREVPTLRYLGRDLEELTRLAETLLNGLAEALGAGFVVETVPERSQVGGGSLPGEDLPTCCVAVRSLHPDLSPDNMAAYFRGYSLPIFTRIKSDALLFDPRTLELDEIDKIVTAARGLTERTA